MNWKIEESKYIVDDPWLKLRADRCRMPNGIILDPYYVVERCDWVNVVAVTDDKKLLMVRQYRHGIGETVIELPAGCVDDTDATPLETIKRELLEETGYSSDNFIFTGKMPLNTSNHNNFTYSYLAENVQFVQAPKPDETEQLEILQLSFDEVYNLIYEGKLQALHTASFLLATKKLHI